MADAPPDGERRLVFSADIVRWGRRDGARQKATQRDLLEVMDHAYRTAGLAPDEVVREAKGDAVMAVIPAGVREADTVAALVRGAYNWLRFLNGTRSPDDLLRMRFACGQGIVEAGPGGLAGDTVVGVFRIRDSAAANARLDEHPDALCVVTLSADVYRSTVLPGRHELQPDQFVPVDVNEKELAVTAYTWVPGRPAIQPPRQTAHETAASKGGAPVAAGEAPHTFVQPGDLVFGAGLFADAIDQPE